MLFTGAEVSWIMALEEIRRDEGMSFHARSHIRGTAIAERLLKTIGLSFGRASGDVLADERHLGILTAVTSACDDLVASIHKKGRVLSDDSRERHWVVIRAVTAARQSLDFHALAALVETARTVLEQEAA